MATEDLPKYPIGVAARMVGVSSATLRAWERRYGVPRPTRTPSRYRLYSDADVEWLRWVRRLVDQGVPPRQAAWLAARSRESGLRPGTTLGVREHLLEALLAFDRSTVDRLLHHASTLLEPAAVFRQILLPAVAEIGLQWEAGRVTVAQEHFASQVALRYALPLLDSRGPSRSPVVCACAPGERHQLGLLAVAVELNSRGLPVVYLGSDTPADSVLKTARTLRARGVLVAAVVTDLAATWGAFRRHVADLQRSGTGWVWGGPMADSARKARLPGYRAKTVAEAVEYLARLPVLPSVS
ncbi:HTH-type transcriptional repressor CarH [bacterium HR32]|jgi:DNA-binding transcriptional MerR regulator|nr:HTH-type transcriptional repressor CarH [bacterium HR32]